ncbi:ARM repeat-containing protein [Hypoxylon rubiginosum]|uniref:ARM repeat-containing protein n=1 Tax=Hypoxylon rubiginosum TaxID=110542 RepID=A0ACC0D117_9PEZI|nr:ARM repeat-containing protein [Hypoxylon rubiginosum]
MPKARTKRQAIRDERKAKRRDKAIAAFEASKDAKRRRIDDADADGSGGDGGDREAVFEDGYEESQTRNRGPPPADREFFGMLSDQEQEYFRSVDEQLDIDDFPSQEERELYLASVFAEAQGKELKLACSQSCSRLMERLILMSNTRQKKMLFGQFASHFMDLIQHRFASHCCETLFLQSAPIVTRELGGERDDAPAESDDPNAPPLPYMEELFLLTLDELEGHLVFLLSDRFASHTLRVLLIILSGRPLGQAQTKSLIHSKKKEKISVPWTSDSLTDHDAQLRAVPMSFNLAAKKIIADTVSDMSVSELRVLAQHPTGNPVLQLLLELDVSLNLKASEDESDGTTLMWRLLPGVPDSLKDATSSASDFVNTMLYHPVGSRLLETIITHCPGKIFKALYKNIFGTRIQSLMRNYIACYPAIRILNRLSKEDLADAVHKSLPEFGKFVTLSRLDVIKVLFERCQARQAVVELESLTNALIEAFGSDRKSLVPKLCLPQSSDAEKGNEQEQVQKNQSAIISHGAHLTTTMLAIPGAPHQAIQTSLASLPEELILQLATSSAPASYVLVTALSTPTKNKAFHKTLVAALRPHAFQLAMSNSGNKVINLIISTPCKGDGISIPFHMKESMMEQLGQHEPELRDSFEGRRAWRTWKGDLWRNRRREWITWAKEVESTSEQAATAPQSNRDSGFRSGYGNGSSMGATVKDNDFSRKRKRLEVVS